MNIPTSLYIHIPCCQQKCPYCDFFSIAARHFPEEEYLGALISDFKHSSPSSINTIFIGGGTPSLLRENFYEKLLNEIQKNTSLKNDIEITMEANPGTLTLEKLKSLRQIGINRLSLGIQSFQDSQLKTLGRIHDSAQAKKIIESANQAGFENINLDLMHGLPNQTLDQAMADLQTAIEFNISHISWYQLTIEENTPFAHQSLSLPDENTIAKIQSHGRMLLSGARYENYEISNYAQPDFACRHNMNYWLFGDYIGIGAGAHEKISTQTQIIRNEKTKYLRDYLNGKFIAAQKTLSQKDIILEFMMNALRLTDGVPIKLFEERTRLSLSAIQNPLKIAYDHNFIEAYDKRIKPTQLGRQFLNDCLQLFME